MSQLFQSSGRPLGLVVLAGLICAAPALADAIAGCVFPLIPRPELFTERSWETGELVERLPKNAILRFRSPHEKGIPVYPHYAILARQDITDWGAKDGRMMTGRGEAVRITPGEHALGRVVPDGFFDEMAEALAGSGDRRDVTRSVRVVAIRTLDHEERVRWPKSASRALTIHFSDAVRHDGKRTNSHRLVVFLRLADTRAASLVARAGGTPDAALLPVAAGGVLALAAGLVLVGTRRRGATR